MHGFKKEQKKWQKNMNVAVLSQGLLSGIVAFTLSPIFLRLSKMEGNPVSGIRESFACGIWNPTSDWNL